MARRLKVLSRVRVPKVNPHYGLINVFERSVVVASRKKLEEVGRETARRVQDVLERQLYNHVPLSPRYAEHKRKTGLDPRILIATKDYLKGIGIRKLADGRIEIGVKDRVHKPSGLPLRILAKIHEFGTREFNVPVYRTITDKNGRTYRKRVRWAKVRIPARPHWRPVISKVKQEIGQTKRDLQAIVRVEIIKFLKQNKTKDRNY